MASRLDQLFRKEVLPSLVKDFNLANPNQAPRLRKICLNMGVGRAVGDAKILDAVSRDLAVVAGQKPVITKARTSVANFKMRRGFKVGCRVTLRRDRMYDFLERLIHMALPRVRDFRGLDPEGFDGRGNFHMGTNELTIFPEVDATRPEFVQQGMNISFVISGGSDEKSRALLTRLGMPFRGK